MNSFVLKKAQITQQWFVIDATDVVLGRLAAFVATILKGKHKVTYTPHMDNGDKVIIINAVKIKLSGKKLHNKVYYRHTGYPGGIKSTTPQKILSSEFSTRVVSLAIKRMLSSGPLTRKRLKNLYVYPTDDHKHTAQKPLTLDFASLNKKNTLK